MYRQQKITLYFPCRNEAAHLKELIDRIPPIVDEIIIVSNKSSDDTIERAQGLGVKALRDDRTKNGIGYGFAHMTGLKEATGDIIVAADGDLTYPIERLESVIDFLLDHSLDFVSCNRYPKKDGTTVPFMLELGVFILNMEVRLLYGKKINDILSGMWILKKEIADKLRLTMGDWNLSPQIKINAMTNPDIKFAEFNIAQYQRAGETKQHYWATGLGHLWWILKNRFIRQ